MDGVVDDVSDRAVVRAVLALTHDLGLDTVAEGVETEQQRQLLVELGCSSLQGYLFSRPVSAADLHDACRPSLRG